MKAMILGDAHLPFDHKNYLKFLMHQRDKEKPDFIIDIGDFIDHYALSRFTLDPTKQGQNPEWLAAVTRAKLYYKEFPEVTWILGNHDERPYRKAQEVGLGPLFLREMKHIYECPEAWNIVPNFELEGVRYMHGVSVGGQTGWQNYSQKIGRSAVFGHIHSVGGVRYHQNPDGKQIFSMAVGCGVDDSAYAFGYGKESAVKSVLGCGFVEDGVYAKFVPMDMSNRAYRRVR